MTTGLISPSTNIKELLAKDPLVQNVVATLANTEYSFTFPNNIKRFRIKARTGSIVKISYTITESGTIFETIWPGSSLNDTNIEGGFTIYFQTSKANEILEITTWKKA